MKTIKKKKVYDSMLSVRIDADKLYLLRKHNVDIAQTVRDIVDQICDDLQREKK